jgi:hypothetical protein
MGTFTEKLKAFEALASERGYAQVAISLKRERKEGVRERREEFVTQIMNN